MRRLAWLTIISAWLIHTAATLAIIEPQALQRPLNTLQHNDNGLPAAPAPVTKPKQGISLPFFASLERLSRLVDIAYCVGSTGLSKPFSCASRCKDFPTLSLITTWNTGILMSDSCGYVAVDSSFHGKGSGAIIVAFRGTYSIANTVVDLSTVPQEYVPYPSPEEGGGKPPKEPLHRCTNCTVHMGFLSSWKEAREVVLPTLKLLHDQYPDYPVHLLGHSLGGAVAALAALEVKVILGWDNVIVTTFGEPRVGNEGFVKYLDAVFDLDKAETEVETQAFRRLTHTDDPVPLLPLSEWGYMSHAGEIFISKSSLSPEPEDIWPCVGDYDPDCIAGSEGEPTARAGKALKDRDGGAQESGPNGIMEARAWAVPARYKFWQLFFAHRDYFWRLGVCLPGGDPLDWGRDRYPDTTTGDEL
ncbi:Alpha/Beta hydrolase protein [Microdochium trichocladiopsis]|uniref:Alpha/Beta hydrolase protein n=1 Tax=Microdochium trichocladiopsis TaxID=1682393 RepID=A0A9P8YB66_9PEZI|nr:Alpha/Beta hydrolase protein [Microdochium trichocladiopsis]KAH7035062.1 Alpha/Beta hydrolase protein [Microdochium trichocladiopsis]